MAPIDPDLVTALDKMMRSDLDASSNFWFWILVGSTIAVAVGIACEAPEVLHAVGFGQKRILKAIARIRAFWYIRVGKVDLNGWQQICPELVTEKKGRRNWIAILGLLGWMLVAIGVAGEGLAEYFVNDAETRLRAFDHEVLVKTQQSANSAAAAASLANTFADKAQKKADSVKGIADEARADAEDALAKAQTAQRELAHAEADAVKAQAAASRL